ncbi:hypothetical protein JW905_18480, partial [bacterium]|nr:hypothetical protein [candidate division CSSED10-310 bacterium]
VAIPRHPNATGMKSTRSYCLTGSIRRFFARPSSLSLEAVGARQTGTPDPQPRRGYPQCRAGDLGHRVGAIVEKLVKEGAFTGSDTLTTNISQRNV